MDKQTQENLAAKIAEKFNIDKDKILGDESFESMSFDSLAMAEILFTLEEDFNISVDESDFGEFPKCYSELVAMIDSKILKSKVSA